MMRKFGKKPKYPKGCQENLVEFRNILNQTASVVIYVNEQNGSGDQKPYKSI
jgi:hypothetical protein